MNAQGYRRVNLSFPDTVGHERISRDMDGLFALLPVVDRAARRPRTSEDYEAGVYTLDGWYVMYENIHPWQDGNGRSGKVLYNWIHGTLLDPVLVDDYFGHGVP
jgi:hypothetical protein